MIHTLVLSALLLAPAPAGADEALWALLRGGGQVIVLRHAQTDPGVGDPPGFRLEACATQRNLSAQGREDARRLGEAGQPMDTVAQSTLELDAGETNFSFILGRLRPGLYEFTGRVGKDGEELNKEGRFAVESYSPEMAAVAVDSTVLGSLSASTGGRLTRLSDPALGIKTGTTTEPVTRTFRMSYDFWIYLLLAALLIKTLAHALLLGPAAAVAWVTRGNSVGMAMAGDTKPQEMAVYTFELGDQCTYISGAWGNLKACNFFNRLHETRGM